MSERKRKPKRTRPSGYAAAKLAGKVPIMLALDGELVQKIDGRRGLVPRATWISERIRRAIFEEESLALHRT